MYTGKERRNRVVALVLALVLLGSVILALLATLQDICRAPAEELMAFVAVRVAPYKKVRKLAVVDQIPKSPSGKILRRVLIEVERTQVSSRSG